MTRKKNGCSHCWSFGISSIFEEMKKEHEKQNDVIFEGWMVRFIIIGSVMALFLVLIRKKRDVNFWNLSSKLSAGSPNTLLLKWPITK